MHAGLAVKANRCHAIGYAAGQESPRGIVLGIAAALDKHLDAEAHRVSLATFGNQPEAFAFPAPFGDERNDGHAAIPDTALMVSRAPL
jgi:hypothetical protein